jgi:flagellar biosynthesis repressor protein FlbT
MQVISLIVEIIVTCKIELKPGERVILGDCLITNAHQQARFFVEGAIPILREEQVLTPAEADTPSKRIYLAVQLMYLAKDPSVHRETYFALVRDVLEAAPSCWPFVENINNHILIDEMYNALEAAKKLIAYEQELVAHAKRRESLQHSGEADRKSA